MPVCDVRCACVAAAWGVQAQAHSGVHFPRAGCAPQPPASAKRLAHVARCPSASPLHTLSTPPPWPPKHTPHPPTHPQDGLGWTALNVASQAGQQEVVKLLVEAHAAVQLPAASGSTPLMSAAERGHADIARLLLQAGGELRMINLQVRPGCVCVCVCGHVHVCMCACVCVVCGVAEGRGQEGRQGEGGRVIAASTPKGIPFAPTSMLILPWHIYMYT